jgi:hypothetical protein
MAGSGYGGKMKYKIIGGLTLVLVGFIVGYVPQNTQLSGARSQVADLTQQLSAEKQARALADFRNSAALLYNEVAKNNFSNAGEQSTKFFTGLRAYTDQSQPPLRQRLEEVLASRDPITAGIAKADPATAALVQAMFLQMQGL